MSGEGQTEPMVPQWVVTVAQHPWVPWPIGVGLTVAIGMSNEQILTNSGHVSAQCLKRYAPWNVGDSVVPQPLPMPGWCAHAFEAAAMDNIILYGGIGAVAWLVWLAVAAKVRSWE